MTGFQQRAALKKQDNYYRDQLLSFEGLPREIELRQKQYEHYRDLLLSFFPKPEAVAA